MAAAPALGAAVIKGFKPYSNTLLLALCLLCGNNLWAATGLLIVSGLGGEDSFQTDFDQQADTLYQSVLSLGLDESEVLLLKGADASKENILAAIAGLKSGSDDYVQVHLIGHGSFDGNNYKFNIPGPDITAVEIAEAMNQIGSKQLIALMTSASGGAMEVLKGDNRLVITATKSGLQKNASVFSRYWARGSDLSSADLNKNEVISLAELYAYTESEVRKYYETEGLIASEASLFEGADSLDPELFSMARIGQLANASLSATAEALLSERASVEEKLSELADRRQQLSEDEYFAELQNLMLELGLLQQQIDRELGTGDE